MVLEGGGSRGAYHIGAYKALSEMDLEIKGVSGTSIGAINGALIVQQDVDRAYDLWYDISPSKVFDVDEEYLKEIKNREITSENISYFLNKAKDVLNNRGLDTKLMREILEKNIDEDRIRKTGMVFGFVTVSLTDRKPMEIYLEDVPRGKLVDYLMASASLPVFKREKTEGKVYLDGAFYDNIPVNVLINKGFKELIVIRTHGFGMVRKAKKKDVHIQYVDPVDDLGGILDFDTEVVRKALKLGYFDALRLFKGFKGREYYISAVNDEQYFLSFFTQMDNENIVAAGEVLGLKNIPPKRMLIEFLLPRITELLDVEKNSGYEDIAVRALEVLARKFEIDRFQVYSFDSFFDKIKEQLNKEIIAVPDNNIPHFVKKNEILSKAAKDSIVFEVLFQLFKTVDKN